MEATKSTVAKNIVRLRQASGMTQAELAAKLGFDKFCNSKTENVEEFISNAVEYENQNENATLGSFLEEISLVADIDNYNQSAEAVVLMTIHSAKGLEYLGRAAAETLGNIR